MSFFCVFLIFRVAGKRGFACCSLLPYLLSVTQPGWPRQTLPKALAVRVGLLVRYPSSFALRTLFVSNFPQTPPTCSLFITAEDNLRPWCKSNSSPPCISCRLWRAPLCRMITTVVSTKCHSKIFRDQRGLICSEFIA